MGQMNPSSEKTGQHYVVVKGVTTRQFVKEQAVSQAAPQ